MEATPYELIVSQQMGWNLGLSGHAGFARWLKDMGQLLTFYVADGANGVVDPDTGEPNSGDTKLDVYTRSGITFPAGSTLQFTWTGAGTIGGNSSGFTDAIPADPNTRLTYNCSGAIAGLSVTVVGESAGQFTDTMVSRHLEQGSCFRMLDPYRINESSPGGAAYSTTNQYIRIRTVTGQNTFHHKTPVPQLVADISNTLEKDIWIPFHHLASNDNISDFVAELVLAGFSRTLYVEHSNEVWNGDFPQHAYATAQAALENPPYGGGGDGSMDRMAWHLDRTNEIAGLAKAEYTSVVGVWGSSRATPAYGTTAWSLAKSDKANVDAIAIALYFGQNWVNNTADATIQTMSNQDIADEVLNSWETVEKPLVQQWISNAATNGKRLVCYEGGPHLFDADTATQAKLVEAAQSNEMGAVAGAVYDWWKLNGNDLLVLFDDVNDPIKPWSHFHGELGPEVARWTAYKVRAA